MTGKHAHARLRLICKSHPHESIEFFEHQARMRATLLIRRPWRMVHIRPNTPVPNLVMWLLSQMAERRAFKTT